MELAPCILASPKSLNVRMWLPPLSGPGYHGPLHAGGYAELGLPSCPFTSLPFPLSTDTPYPQPFPPEAPCPANLCQHCLFLLDLVPGWMAGALPLLSLSPHPYSPTLCTNRLRATGRSLGQVTLPQRASVRDTAGDVARCCGDPKEKLPVTWVGPRTWNYGT